MNTPIVRTILFALCFCFLGLLGCKHEDKPPPPLAVEQIPSELQKVFKVARQETKELIAKVSSGLQTKDYVAAYDAVQALCSVPDASTDQRAMASRAMLTIYGLLQAAQSQGDEQAAAALKFHQMTK
jgi:hypothetical protein